MAYYINHVFGYLQVEMGVVKINGYHDVPENDELSLLKALAHQPLSVAIEASDRDFQFYSGVSMLAFHIICNHSIHVTSFLSALIYGMFVGGFTGCIQRAMWS